MDDTTLKKMAIRSMTLMFTVILISATSANYNDISIYANDNNVFGEKEVSAMDVASLKVTNTNIIEEESLLSIDGQIVGKKPEEILSNKYIMLDKPTEGNTTISLEDNYMDRSIKLTLSGLKSESVDYDSIVRMINNKSFVGKPLGNSTKGDPIIYETDDIARNITISYDYNIEKDNFTANIIIELDTVYAYTMYQDIDQYYINLQKPKDVYNKLIVVDAGHGGNDVGTFPTGMEYVEKDINLSIVLYLKQLLDREDIKVYYTRLDDTKPYLRPRVRLANDLEADFFISVHCNGSSLSQPYGTEVLYDEKSTQFGFNSKQLAQICLDELSNAMNSRNRGIVEGHEKFIVGNSKVPVALLEVGYITNPEDLEFLKNSENHKLIAEGVYNGIIESFKEIEKE